MPEYKIRHILHGDNEHFERSTTLDAESEDKAREKFLNDFTEHVDYWDFEIIEVIEKTYS